jgi:PAS domain-containing protein
MQIMNLKKFFKNVWWTLSAFKTVNELPDAIIFVDKTGNIRNFNKRAKEIFGLE